MKGKVKPLIYEVEELGEDIMIQQLETLKIGKASIKLDTPNSTAMYLNASERELKTAKALHKELIEPKISTRIVYQLSDSDASRLYNYFEHVKMSIIMACTAV